MVLFTLLKKDTMFRYTFLFVFCFISYCYPQQPKPFLSSITSLFPNVRDLAISPNGDELVFSAQSTMSNLSVLISIKKKDGEWDTPKVASFSGKYFDLEPFFSHDGLTLYFASSRPLDSSSLTVKDFDIWYVTRKTTTSNWSEPKNIGNPINTKQDEFYPSVSKNGNMYFTRNDVIKNRKDDIYVSEFKKGIYTIPKALNDSINSNGYEYNAFIAPDESYLLFGAYNRPDGFGSGDLYISYRTGSEWTKAKNLGSTINSNMMDYCPLIYKDTLYFTSKRDDTKIEQETPLNFTELLKELHKPNNGSSKLYMVPEFVVNHLFKK